jgi:tetratricopeptide (TPR) repeat protein
MSPRIPALTRRGALLCAIGVLLSAGAAQGAFCEFDVTRTADAPAEAVVAEVTLWPCGVDETRAVVQVRDAAGAPAGHETIWRAPGEPWTLRFDASAGTRWTVRLDDAPAAAAAATGDLWRAQAGLLMETRALPPGPAETLDDILRLWSCGSACFGRSSVERIHHAIHPHGPAGPLLCRYEGWLRIPADGRYGFATVSDDASFLLIDGRPVAEWGGRHGVDGGLRAEKSGETELRRGTCRIEYYNAQHGDAFCVGAAWRPPGARHFTIIPADAFVPVAAAGITGVRAAPDSAAAAAAFGWRNEGHVLVGTQAWVEVRAWALAPEGATRFRWRFDDGTTAEGPVTTHLFLAPGRREISLEVWREATAAGRLSRHVPVAPCRTQREEFPPERYAAMRAEVLRRDLLRLPLDDLCSAALLADQTGDTGLLDALGTACVRRLPEFDAGRAPVLYRLGFHFQSPASRRYPLTTAAWRGLLACQGVAPPLAAATRLHLAGFLIHCGGSLSEARALLAECDTELLDATERRLHGIFTGDAAAAAGDAAAARQHYLAAGATVAPDDTGFEVRRQARLERARVFIRRGEFDEAEKVLREIEWERPLSRMGLDTGLLLIEVFRGRGETPQALAACRRLLAVAPPGPRLAALLRAAAEVCAEQGLEEEARRAAERLQQEFPYSEEAAMLKDRDVTTPRGTAAGRERAGEGDQ